MNRVYLLCLCVLTGACAGPTPDPAPAPAAAPKPSPTPAPEAGPRSAPEAESPTPDPAAPPQAGESRVLTGVLRYTEPPTRKSVEAYLGQELVLVEGDQSWNLGATKDVPHEQLQALDGKRIEVTATYVPPRAPDPREQAPMDGDQPMKRPEQWSVTAVKVLGE